MSATPLEPWQREILVRDELRAMTTISHIANALYPELPFARDREARLLEIPEMRRLADKLRAVHDDCHERLRVG